MIETKGAMTEQITPEFIADNIDAVLDTTDGYVIATS
jgi:hypothetical protein